MLQISLNLVQKAAWSPSLRPVRHRHRLPKVIELQSTATHRAQNGSIVDDLTSHSKLSRSDEQVRVRGGSVGVGR